MNRPWMPLHIGDYLRDTRSLNAAEHGAYLLLIMEYWVGGKLPEDDASLARIACMTRAQWARAKTKVQSFFHDGWRHKRIDKELAHSIEVTEKRRTAALQRHSKLDAIAQQVDTQPTTNKNISSLRSETREPKKSRRKPETPWPEDWQCDEAERLLAHRHGLSTSEGEREFARFRSHAKATDRRLRSWPDGLDNWFRKAGEILGRVPPAESAEVVEISGYYAKPETPQYDAWQDHLTKERGRHWAMTDRNGGWRFPTEWPPGYNAPAKAVGG